MPLNRKNTRNRHRVVAGGKLERVKLLKRGDDLREGEVVAHLLFQCYWEQVTKTGEPIYKDMASDHRRTIHIPVIELKRVGVNYLNVLDRLVDKQGRYWQPESGNMITSKTFENYYMIDCVRRDPPENQVTL